MTTKGAARTVTRNSMTVLDHPPPNEESETRKSRSLRSQQYKIIEMNVGKYSVQLSYIMAWMNCAIFCEIEDKVL